MKTSVIVLLTLWFAMAQACAQNIISLQTSVSVPTNDLRKDFSYRGFGGISLGLLQKTDSSLAFGASVDWHGSFKQKYGTFSDDAGIYTGIQYKWIDLASIHITCLSYPRSHSKIKPFGGLGIGTTYIETSTDIESYHSEENGWYFSLRPELGFLYPLKEFVYLKFSATYVMSSQRMRMGDISFLSFNLGFSFEE